MQRLLFLLCAIVTLSACKEQADKKQLKKTEDTLHVAKSFSNPSVNDTVTGTRSHLPRLFSNGNMLYFSWVTVQDSLATLKYSTFDRSEWSLTKEVSEGKDWFVNWADFPVISENNGSVLTSHLQKSASGTYTYDIKLNYYNNETGDWKRDFLLHNDGTKSEHGFVSILPYPNTNDFFITWLDGRKTIGNDSLKGHGDAHNTIGAMSLRSAHVTTDGSIVDRRELDPKVCDCCQTSAAMTTNGPIVVYRDRSDEEVRDISIVRSLGDQQWSEPKTVYNDNWKINGCPVNGPSVSALKNTVAVAWYTAANEKPKIQVVFSEDNGESFGLPIRLDGNDALGRVDVALLSKTEAAVVWMEMVGDETLIQLAKVDSNGSRGEFITISKTSPERSSGFPQLERVDDTLYIAWTLNTSNSSRIETATVPVSMLE